MAGLGSGSMGSLGGLDRGDLMDGLLKALLLGGQVEGSMPDVESVDAVVAAIERCMSELRSLYVALEAGQGLAEIGMSADELAFAVEFLCNEMVQLQVRAQGLMMACRQRSVG